MRAEDRGSNPPPNDENPRIAYLVTDLNCDGGYTVGRVYLDRAEAEAFVEAYNAAGGYYEVEETQIGAPAVAYDGPVWLGTWTTRRKQKGEKQLVMVSDGFTTVVPSAVPSDSGYRYTEFFSSGPGWRDLAKPLEYEEPPVWIDNFYYRQEWHTGDDPTPAAIDVSRGRDNHIEVRGTSKDAVDALLRSTALQVKAERGIG